MKTYISILRGINVGPHKRIKMDVLQKMYEDLGFHHIRIYIQSGNVVFRTQEVHLEVLEQLIQARIFNDLKFEVPVFVLDLESLTDIVENNPFSSAYDNTFLHITLLASTPAFENAKKINTDDFAPDEFQILNRMIYLYCPNGYGKTKLTNGFFESKLKITATTRNWKTTLKLLEIAKESDI